MPPFDMKDDKMIAYLLTLDVQAFKKVMDEKFDYMDLADQERARHDEFMGRSDGMSEEDRTQMLETEYRDLIVNYEDKLAATKDDK